MFKAGRFFTTGHWRIKRAFIIIVIAVIISLAVKSRFTVKNIIVSGNELISDGAVIALAGITRGADIIRINESDIKRNIENNPYLQLLDFAIAYPDTIKVKVAESRARAIVVSAGVMLLIDDNCRLLESMSQMPVRDVIVVTGLEVNDRRAGQRIGSTKQGQVKALEAVLAAISNRGLDSKIRELNIENINDINIIAGTGVRVKLGDSANILKKMVWFETVHDQLASSGATGGLLDVSSGNRGIYINN
jgi:cell division septal protein FtsQ